MSKHEMEAMKIIMHSGNAKSNAYEALSFVKNRDFLQGKELMAIAEQEILLAQKEHAKLLQEFAINNGYADMLLVHAEDHVSSSQIVVDLISEMIIMYERFGGY